MKREYIVPVAETHRLVSEETFAAVSVTDQVKGNGMGYGGVDEAGELDPSARGRGELTEEELQELNSRNEWEDGLW